MSPEKFRSGEKGSHMRFLMVIAINAILSSGCVQEEKSVDKDLSGIQDEPDAHVIKEVPVKKQDEPKKQDNPDAGKMSEEEYKKLYDSVVEALRLKNGRTSHKHQ